MHTPHLEVIKTQAEQYLQALRQEAQAAQMLQGQAIGVRQRLAELLRQWAKQLEGRPRRPYAQSSPE